jgi:hypothetical protein
LPRPTNPISIKRAFLLAYDDTIRICGRAAGTAKELPALPSASDYPALDLGYSNIPVVQRPRP